MSFFLIPRSSRLVPRTSHLFFPVRIDEIFEDCQGRLRALGGGNHDLLVASLHVPRGVNPVNIRAVPGVVLDVAVRGQFHSQLLGQSHLGVVADGHENAVDRQGFLLPRFGVGQDDFLDFLVAPDFLHFRV